MCSLSFAVTKKPSPFVIILTRKTNNSKKSEIEMWSPDRREKVVEHQELLKKRALTAPNKNKNAHLQQEDASSSSLHLPLPPIRGAAAAAAARADSNNADVETYNPRSMAVKVRAQRLERLLRQHEESELQARVNEHLVGILAKHKQHKAQMMDRWKSHAQAPIPEPPPIVRRKMELEAEIKRQQKERRERIKNASRLPRAGVAATSSSGSGGMFPHVGSPASAKSGRSSALMMPNQSALHLLRSSSPVNDGVVADHANSEAAKANARHAAAFAEVSQIYDTVFSSSSNGNANIGGKKQPQKQDISVSAMLSDFIPSSILSMTQDAKYGPMLVGLSPEQRKRLMDVEAKHQKLQAKVAAKQAMFERAQHRRKVATQRIKDDPPADVLVQADLRRYIPADLLDASVSARDGDQNGGRSLMPLPPGFDPSGINRGKPAASFFLTDVDAEKRRAELEEQGATVAEEFEGAGGAAGVNKKSLKKGASTVTTKRTRSKLQAQKDGTAKSRVLHGGGPLASGANNKSVSIFAREVLLRVATTTRAREMREQSKQSQEEMLIRARREALGNDDDNDSEFDDQGVARQALSSARRHHQHAPTGLDSVAERHAALEWYRRYHQPIAGVNKNARGMGKVSVVAAAGGGGNASQWKPNHNLRIPLPSRTLFFESEKPREPLRRSLFKQ